MGARRIPPRHIRSEYRRPRSETGVRRRSPAMRRVCATADSGDEDFREVCRIGLRVQAQTAARRAKVPFAKAATSTPYGALRQKQPVSADGPGIARKWK